MSRLLRVYLDGTPVGDLTQTSGGSLGFAYDEDYRRSPGATPLSLSMPLLASRHTNRTVRAFFDGLLPDSLPARQRWARQYQVSASDPFALLRHVGRDAAGAVQVLPPEIDPSDAARQDGDIEWISDGDFAAMARDLAEHGADWDPGRYGGRWSLAGAQPKMALFRDPDTGRWGIPRDSTPTTHIIKPAIEGFASHHINEALCLLAADEMRLLAAAVELVEVEGVQAVISHRYDRRRDAQGRWHREHQEDLCQALGVHPDKKYQSAGGPGVGEIGALLAALGPEDRQVNAERFFGGLAFNVLVGGTDAHAKNYSLVLIGARAQVAPLYDVASAAAYPQYERLSGAMMVGEHWRMLDVTMSDWAKAAQRLGIGAEDAHARVMGLRAGLPGAFARAVERLPIAVRDEAHRTAGRIVEHVEGTWRPDLARNPARDRPLDG